MMRSAVVFPEIDEEENGCSGEDEVPDGDSDEHDLSVDAHDKTEEGGKAQDGIGVEEYLQYFTQKPPSNGVGGSESRKSHEEVAQYFHDPEQGIGIVHIQTFGDCDFADFETDLHKIIETDERTV